VTVSIQAVEILKPGTFWDATGQKVVLTLDDLKELAAGYDPELQDAPLVVGHPKLDDPQYGRIQTLRLDGEVLLADLDQVDPEFAETLKQGRFNKRSLAFFGRRSKGNPKPGSLYPKHLGLLGAKAPAVKGLKPIQFAAADDATVIELAGPGWRLSQPASPADQYLAHPVRRALRSLADLFTRRREAVIEKDSIEAADKEVPAYAIDDLRAAAAEIEAGRAPEEAAPLSAPSTCEVSMPTPEELAARQAELDAQKAALDAQKKTLDDREAELAAAETQARRRDDEAYVDGLIKEGRLRPTERVDVLAELAALDDGEPTIQLAAAEDGKPVRLTPRQAYRRRLAQGPRLVELGEVAGGGADAQGVVAFAAPDGFEIDRGRLEIHQRAKAYQAAHPGTDYLAAVKAVGGK